MALSVYTPTGIVHETSVDFTKRVLTEPVHLVQYDESLPVVAITCLDAGQYMMLMASDTVSIRMDKGDGTFIYNPALGMSADGHIVYIQITLQMTVNYGRFEPVLELLRGNGYGCSSPVPLFIDRNPVSNEAIQSTDEFQTVQNMYNTVVEFSDALDYLNTPQAQTDVANAEENANAAIASASAAAASESNAADSEANAAASAAAAQAVVDSSTITFTEAAERTALNSGDTISTLFGKVKKWLNDLFSMVTQTKTIGSNYVVTKFPDGTMIQQVWADVSITGTQIGTTGIYKSLFSYTFPESFISNNDVVVNGIGRYETGFSVALGCNVINNLNQVTGYIYDFYQRSGDCSIRLVAIGRWK